MDKNFSDYESEINMMKTHFPSFAFVNPQVYQGIRINDS